MKRVAPVTAILALSVSLLLASEFDRPFGIEHGQKLQTLDRPQRDGENFYKLRSVPKPHPLLSKYSVVATGDAGEDA